MSLPDGGTDLKRLAAGVGGTGVGSGYAVTVIEERVGVVIPTFNTGSYVLEAAESAHVGLGSLENIVVVDDGSTERATLESLALLERRGFRIHRQPNGGVSAARNNGIASLATPYVFALDSDDILTPTAPSVAAEILDRHDDVAIVAGGGVDFDDHGNIADPVILGEVTRDVMRNGTVIATASAFRRSDWARCGGFPEGLAIGEDWVFWMRVLRLGGEVHTSKEVFVRHRIHSGQVTRGYIDPRQAIKARNLVLLENQDLFSMHMDEISEELASLRSQLAVGRYRRRWLLQSRHLLEHWTSRMNRTGATGDASDR